MDRKFQIEVKAKSRCLCLTTGGAGRLSLTERRRMDNRSSWGRGLYRDEAARVDIDLSCCLGQGRTERASGAMLDALS